MRPGADVGDVARDAAVLGGDGVGRVVAPSSRAHLVIRAALVVAVVGAMATAVRPGGSAPRSDVGEVVVAGLVVACVLGVLAFLVVGPEPRFATRWAWGWLMAYVPPAALVFLLLEPTPLGTRRPRTAPRRRLTGWWGLLIGLVVGGALMQLVRSI